jgi:hypothetical protein
MNPRNSWILASVAVALFAFIYFFERHLHEPVAVGTKVLPAFKAAAVTSIRVQPARQFEIRADRTNDTWILTKPVVSPAQSLAIDALLKALQEMTFIRHISAEELRGNPKVNEDYGFDEPSFTLVVQDGAESPQIKFGKLTMPGDGVYVRVVGTEGVDIVSTEIFRLIPRQKNDWRDTAFINLKKLVFDRLTVKGAKMFELQRDAASKPWRMTRPMQARADNPKVDELLYRLETLRVNQFVTDEPRADLETYGLQPPQWELNLDNGTNSVASLQFGKSPTNDESRIYARRGGQPSVVLVPRDAVEPWNADHEKFRDPRLASLTRDPLDIIEVHDKTEEFALRRDTNDLWRIIAGTRTMPADPTRTRDLIEALGKLEITPFNGHFAVKDVVTDSDLPNYGLADPLRRYVLKRDVTASGGASASTVAAELDFGSITNDCIFARRGDRPEETSVYAVKLADFQKLPYSSLALRDRRVWHFPSEAVRQITIRQYGTNSQFAHVGTNNWVFVGGTQGIFDKFALESGVEELGDLEAASWVGFGDQNRVPCGFSNKSIQISVELFGVEKPLTLELGGWSPNRLRYAAVQLDGETWIFEVPEKQLARILYDFNVRDKAAP